MLDNGGCRTCRVTLALAAPIVCASRGQLGRTELRLSMALLALLLAAPAGAEWRPTALLRFASSYVYHGYDKSDDHPITQAHAGVADDTGVYGGLWLTQLDFGGAQLEAIPYLGAQRQLGAALRVDAVLSGYIYDSNVFGRDADYAEASVALDWHRLLSVRVAAAFDSYGGATHTGLALDYPAYGAQVTALRALQGERGNVVVQCLTVRSLGATEEFLLMAATAGAQVLDAELTDKLLTLPATVMASATVPAAPADDSALQSALANQERHVLRGVEQRNLSLFAAETDKLDAWADDLRVGLEREIKELDRPLKRPVARAKARRPWPTSWPRRKNSAILKRPATASGVSSSRDRTRFKPNAIS